MAMRTMGRGRRVGKNRKKIIITRGKYWQD
jgi:hypothetical protein